MITLIGSLPQILMVFVVFQRAGMKMVSEEPVDNSIFLMCALAL